MLLVPLQSFLLGRSSQERQFGEGPHPYRCVHRGSWSETPEASGLRFTWTSGDRKVPLQGEKGLQTRKEKGGGLQKEEVGQGISGSLLARGAGIFERKI